MAFKASRRDEANSNMRGFTYARPGIGNRAANSPSNELGTDQYAEFDPMLARMLFLHRLPARDQLNWIDGARTALSRARNEILAKEQASESYGEIVRRATIAMLDLRLKSLDELSDRILEKDRAEE